MIPITLNAKAEKAAVKRLLLPIIRLICPAAVPIATEHQIDALGSELAVIISDK